MKSNESFSVLNGFYVSLYFPVKDLASQKIDAKSLEDDYVYFLRSHDHKTSVRAFANSSLHTLNINELFVFKQSNSILLNCKNRAKFTLLGIQQQFFNNEKSSHPFDIWMPHVYQNYKKWIFEDLIAFSNECESALPGKTEMLKTVELVIVHKIIRFLNTCSK